MSDCKYLSASEAAVLLGVSRRSVSRWCEQGRIPAHRTAGGDRRRGAFRIAPSAVEAFKRKGLQK